MKMQKNTLLICFSLILLSFSSCKEENDIERVSIEPILVKTDLLTSMPGNLLAIEDKLIWFDLNPDAFLHIEDEKTGNTWTETGTLGSGPEDFNAPFLSWYPNGKVLVTDCFANRAMVLSLENMSRTDLDVPFSKKSLQCIGNGLFIQPNTENGSPFTFWANGKGTAFGKFPLENEKISNTIDKFQGVHAFNPYNGYLIQSFPELSHIMLYRLEGNTFEEIWTKVLPDLDYQINSEGVLKINDVPHPAPSAIALTKDYIITIERDEQTQEVETKSSSENRFVRAFSKTPQTLFVYDYEFNLKKILYTRIPMFRLAARGNDNTVYFMGVKEEFCINKCVIEE